MKTKFTNGLLLVLIALLIGSSATAQTFTVLHNFGSAQYVDSINRYTNSDGANPYAQLIQGSDGKLYSATLEGGTNGYGTIFSLNTNGTEFTVLHYFNINCYLSDSWGGGLTPNPSPQSLLQGIDGNLYGVAVNSSTVGAAYKLKTDGSGFTIIKNFPFPASQGGAPVGLTQASDGKLYGVNEIYGFNSYYGGGGTIYSLNTNGSGFSVLGVFDATPFGYSTNGTYPDASLIQGSDGKLYGTASTGGTNVTQFETASIGGGTVFSLNLNGSNLIPLHNFDYPSSRGINAGGSGPTVTLLQGNDGKLYGTTSYGGTNGSGVIFRMNTDGTGYTVIHVFNAYPYGQATSKAALIQGRDGRLYGMSNDDSPPGSGLGSVYSLNPDGGDFTTIYTFGKANDGGASGGIALIQGSDGKLYGTTSGGGAYNNGTVFALTLPSPLVINTTNGFFGFTNQQFSFTLTGPANSNAVISASTDLHTWTPIFTNTLTSGALNFTDILATNYSLRFYRAQLQ